MKALTVIAALGATLLASLAPWATTQLTAPLAAPGLNQTWPPLPKDMFHQIYEEATGPQLQPGQELIVVTVPTDKWLVLNFHLWNYAQDEIRLFERSTSGVSLRLSSRVGQIEPSFGRAGVVFAPGSQVVLRHTGTTAGLAVGDLEIAGYYANASPAPLGSRAGRTWPVHPERSFLWVREIVGNPGLPVGGELLVATVPMDSWLVLSGGSWPGFPGMNSGSSTPDIHLLERTGAGDRFRANREFQATLEAAGGPMGLAFSPGSQVIIKNNGTQHQLLGDTTLVGYFVLD